MSKATNHSGLIPALVTVHDASVLPKRLVRAGRRGNTWSMPRRFARYEAVSHEQLSVGGAAPKFILRSSDDLNDWFVVKRAEKWGEVETLSELLNNVLGRALGFPMAPAGLVRVDGVLCFASRNFQRRGETLIHGSLLLEQILGDIGGVGRKKWDEQRTYDIDLIAGMFESSCGFAAGQLLDRLLEMIVFDALIGSMDRHLQNWGLLATVEEPRTYRFAPIFDSARALLWNQDEAKLEMLRANRKALDAYIARSCPIMGCASTGTSVNHFQLVQHLAGKYPRPVWAALDLVRPDKVEMAARVLDSFPFAAGFSGTRRIMIADVLRRRCERLHLTARI